MQTINRITSSQTDFHHVHGSPEVSHPAALECGQPDQTQSASFAEQFYAFFEDAIITVPTSRNLVVPRPPLSFAQGSACTPLDLTPGTVSVCLLLLTTLRRMVPVVTTSVAGIPIEVFQTAETTRRHNEATCDSSSSTRDQGSAIGGSDCGASEYFLPHLTSNSSKAALAASGFGAV
ncbi:MAG: hypothetical protein JWQ81_5247 [Amycolatopsis sp.]|nr:hypothetical protein [Amycolatopsis sp.]